MKRAFLLIVVPALLVALGFAQTPAASSNTDQTTIKGCLGGSDGNYTVVEDNTGHTFKITTSTVDLKPHLGHDVTLIGHKAGGASSAPADNSLAVTEVKMISEHCAAAATAATAPVTTPTETAGSPPAVVATTAPATATAPAATATTPAETPVKPAADTTPPAATATTPAETAGTPAAAATPPAATITAPAETAITPAAGDTPPAVTAVTPAAVEARPAETTDTPVADSNALVASTPAETVVAPSAHPRKRSETPAAATTTPAVLASTPAATAVVPVAADTSSPAPASTPAAVPTTPTPASKGWSLWLLIAFGVLVLVMGVMFPFVSRWRKQKNLERTDAPNLSFNREASSAGNKSGQSKPDQGKSDEQRPRKAA
jgi:hypothetical protein